mgnify:CR=1 FL=1
MPRRGLIQREGSVLVVIDLQEKLLPHIAEKDEISKNIEKLVRFAKIMRIPIVMTEQYPKGLGPTILGVKQLVPETEPIEKVEFSCFGSERFTEALARLKARTLIIAGIEAHICVTQTAIEAVSNGYEAYVVSDGVSSRRLDDKATALERMRQSGVTIASTEMLMYELLEKAGTPEFKAALEMVK